MQLFRPLLLMAMGLAATWLSEAHGAEATDFSMKPETIKISNSVCEAVITTKPFVHLIGFRLTGGKNHLLNFATPNPLHDGKPMRPEFIVGAKLWIAPEVEGSHLFGMVGGNVTQKAGEVDALLDADPRSGLQGKIHFHLDPDRALLTIASSLRNVGTAETETSCWWPVSFEPGGRMESEPMPLPTEPMFAFHFWNYGGPATDPVCQIEKTNVVLDLDRPMQAPVYKIGFLGREILVIKPDVTYRVTALDPAPSAQLNYPHGNSPVMLFRDQRTWFCEAELSGPLVQLRPGDETSFTFSIALEPTK